MLCSKSAGFRTGLYIKLDKRPVNSKIYINLLLHKLAYGMQLNLVYETPEGCLRLNVIQQYFLDYMKFLTAVAKLLAILCNCLKLCVNEQLCYGTKIPSQKRPIVVCCFSSALHRKTTPNSRQEGNQYNTQHLAILSQERIWAMTSQPVSR